MYFDIGIVAVMALGALIGLAKGFFKPFNRLLATVIAFVVIYFTLDMVREYALGVDAIKAIVDGMLAKLMQGFAPDALKEATVTTDLTGILNSGFFKFIEPSISRAAAQLGTKPIDAFGLVMAHTTFNILLSLIMLGAFRLVLVIFTMILDAFTRDRDITGLARLLGFIVGAVRGAVFAFVILVIATPFMTLIPQDYRDDLDKNSVVTKPATEFIYENVTKLLDFDKLLGTDPDEDDGSTDETEEEREARELSEKQGEVSAAKAEVIAKLNSVYSYEVYVQLTNVNAFIGYGEFIKANGALVTYINALPDTDKTICGSTLDQLDIIEAAFISTGTINVKLVTLLESSFTAPATAETVFESILSDITTVLTNFIAYDEEATITVPASVSAWIALEATATVTAPTESQALIDLRTEVTDTINELLADLQALYNYDVFSKLVLGSTDVSAYKGFAAYVSADGALDVFLTTRFDTADTTSFQCNRYLADINSFADALFPTDTQDPTMASYLALVEAGTDVTTNLTEFLAAFQGTITLEFSTDLVPPTDLDGWAQLDSTAIADPAAAN